MYQRQISVLYLTQQCFCLCGKPGMVWCTCGWKLSHQAVLAHSHCWWLRIHSKDRCTTSCTPSFERLPKWNASKQATFLGPLCCNKGLGMPPSLRPLEQGDHVTLGEQQAPARCRRLKSILDPPTPPRHWSCLAVREIVIGGRK